MQMYIRMYVCVWPSITKQETIAHFSYYWSLCMLGSIYWKLPHQTLKLPPSPQKGIISQLSLKWFQQSCVQRAALIQWLSMCAFLFVGAQVLLDVSSAPHPRDIMQLLSSQVAAKWKDLALHLGVELYICNNISRNHPQDCEEACWKMLNRWLQGERGTGERCRTWRSLLTAAHQAGYVELVEVLRREHFKPFWNSSCSLWLKFCDIHFILSCYSLFLQLYKPYYTCNVYINL